MQTLLNSVHKVSGLDHKKYQEIIDGLVTNLTLARQEGRCLRLAVVGQMKVGKSSFLNAALFKADILPKAATPMTAALTKIAHSDSIYAEITFYTEQDWRSIAAKSSEYLARYAEVEAELKKNRSPFAKVAEKLTSHTIPASQIITQIDEELRAYHELFLSAQHINVSSYFGKIIRLDAATIAELADYLPDYVGSSGRFTPLVKMSSLHINDESLRGLEIYDTPGFNDPVISRGKLTRDFLAQCDIVFLLSSCNQFLSKSDLILLREQLVQSGIDSGAVLMVATQRDLALRMDSDIMKQAQLAAQKKPEAQRSGYTVAAMLKLLDQKMRDMAFTTLDRHLADSGLDTASRDLLSNLRTRPPLTISSWSARLAEQTNLGADDREQLEQLCRSCNFDFNQSHLHDLSNISAIKSILIEQKNRKDSLHAVKEKNLRHGAQSAVTQALRNDLNLVSNKIQQLNRLEINQLESIQAKLEAQLLGGRNKLLTVYEDETRKIKSQLTELAGELSELTQSYQHFETHSRTEVKFNNVNKSGFWAGLARLLDMGGYDKVRTEIVSQYAQTQDVIQQIESFALDAQQHIQLAIAKATDSVVLREKLLCEIVQLFDFGEDDFDPNLLNSQINQALDLILTPKIFFETKNYADAIVAQFGRREVKDAQMKLLQETQMQTINAVLRDIETELNAKAVMINKFYQKSCNGLLSSINSNLQQGIDQICADLKNKKEILTQLTVTETALKQLLLHLDGTSRSEEFALVL